VAAVSKPRAHVRLTPGHSGLTAVSRWKLCQALRCAEQAERPRAAGGTPSAVQRICDVVIGCPLWIAGAPLSMTLRTTLRREVFWERQLRDQRGSFAQRTVERHCPAERLDSVLQPYKTRAASWVCPADAVGSNTDPQAAVA
jgi:hypothetical protein